ncbi:MAG TPA: thioesterase family protein, partial [Thermoleophilaceae bacterium]|nr:thioesterase family protein [Thermoleophilaceae bacterium]
SALAFYLREGGEFAATELPRGPWDFESQHAGPPCALLGRAVDRAGALEGARMARITFEILRPVPIAHLTCTAQVVRPGRSVELIDGVLSCEGLDLIRARGWRIRTEAVALHEQPPAEDQPPGPDQAQARRFFPVDWDAGYHTAMEVRFLSGSYTEAGPARAWMRMRVPLLEGEEPSALDRVLVAADSGNGVSSPLDYRRYLFINADLSVALRRLPTGEWVCLDSVTYAEPDGVGLSDTALLDERGIVGRATQSLLVRSR